MCGIAGFIKKSNNIFDSKEILKKFIEKLSHRGPNSHGQWISDDDRVGLAHTRLSIQDLSSNGNQPMISHNSRYIIVYNGEIYNSPVLKKELQNLGTTLISNSDTEILLELISQYGIDKTLSKLEGMFAFSIYDKINKLLYLVRDRIGEKPLYYGDVEGDFFFSSELKVFKIFKNKLEISSNAVNEYLKYNYIPANLSIYKNIYKLPPGSYLKINLNTSQALDESNLIKWWKLEHIYKKNNISRSENENLEHLNSLLNQAVKKQLISDVPVGCFLSGGVDSSLIASYMQSNVKKKINTFSIGFENKEYDESSYARQISKFIDSNHFQLMIDYKKIEDSIPNLVDVYDEPYADTSQIPTLFMSRFAKEKVGVVLSGDGGDELFGGYNRYIWAPKALKYKNNLIFKKFFDLLNSNNIEFIYNLVKPFLISKYKFKSPKDKIIKFKKTLTKSSDLEIYKDLTRNTNNKYIKFENNYDHNSDILDRIWSLGNSFEDKMMLSDILTYLPDDILVKIDRASMACSLETRVPFLDKSVIEFGINLNNEYKFSNNQNKILLRKLLSNKIPKKLLMSNKRGFDSPMDEWMRKPLKNWCNDMLNSSKLYSNFDINKKSLINDWHDFIDNKNEKMFPIWNMVILSSWLEKN